MEHKDVKVDAKKTVAMGHSAGGALALTTVSAFSHSQRIF
jgi:acetyl esterase/lipase